MDYTDSKYADWRRPFVGKSYLWCHALQHKLPSASLICIYCFIQSFVNYSQSEIVCFWLIDPHCPRFNWLFFDEALIGYQLYLFFVEYCHNLRCMIGCIYICNCVQNFTVFTNYTSYPIWSIFSFFVGPIFFCYFFFSIT